MFVLVEALNSYRSAMFLHNILSCNNRNQKIEILIAELSLYLSITILYTLNVRSELKVCSELPQTMSVVPSDRYELIEIFLNHNKSINKSH